MVLSITQGVDAQALITSLVPVSPDISYRNANLIGHPNCASLFTNGTSVVDDYDFPNDGLILGTGLGESLLDQDGTESYYDFGTVGDTDIAQGETRQTFDACILEFEFSCNNIAGGWLNVEYIFSSDEYKEQVIENLGYADKFALLLNGVNIATIPGTNDPVGVYTINHENNTQYFVFNDPRPNQATYPRFEPDGFTTLLNTTGTIETGWNTMKIGIVDVNDPFFDSWLFLKQGSFECIPDPLATWPPTPAPTVDNDIGSASGDPHFRTFDNQFFSYHGQCDLVLSRSKGFASGKGLDVHVRTTRVSSPHMDYSYISGAAVKIGSDVLEVLEGGDLIVNGEEIDLDDNAEMSFSEYALAKTVKGKKQRIIVHDLDLGDNRSIQIRTNTKTGMLFVDLNGAFDDSEGLLGSAPALGKPLLARDGSTDLTGHWNTYGEEWQVNKSDPKIFQDSSRHPQYPRGCVYEAEMKKSHLRRRHLMEINPVSLEEATGACAHLTEEHMQEFCVNDIMATGDLDLVEDPFYSSN